MQKFLEAIQEHHVRDLLAEAADQGADVYWYPGCRHDLVPLLLARRDTSFLHNLYEPGLKQDKPLLLWLNDKRIGDNVQAFFTETIAYERLWHRFQTEFRIQDIRQFSLIPNHPDQRHFCVDVEVIRPYPADSQVFQILVSHVSAQDLLAMMVSWNLHITWLALIRVGAFGGGNLYDIIPEKLERYQSFIGGMPELIVGDRDWNRDGLKGYERMGSRDPDWNQEGGHLAKKRVHGGGVKGWGFQTAAMWVRSEVYEIYEERMKKVVGSG